VCVDGECVEIECGGAEDCDDGNECTEDICKGGVCEYPPVEDGTACANGAGVCQAGTCAFACTEQGIRDAIAAGGGPHTFDCDGLTPVVTQAEIVIDNNVILDGEGNLTVDARYAHRVFAVASGVTAELRGMTITGGRPTEQSSGDHLRFNGGGVFNSGVLTVANSTVSHNTAWGGGGGIVTFHGELTVENSTVSGNAAGGGGGGIHVQGLLTVTNSTVSGNTADSSGGGIFFVSGIHSLTLTHSTVSGNTSSRGDGLASDSANLTNTLVDNDCYWFIGAEIVSGGYNVESPGNTCGFDQQTDQVNVSAQVLQLGPLRDNGGPTETHALLPGSVAIDAIPGPECLLTEDQRGEPRPETGGTVCDVGALEAQP